MFLSIRTYHRSFIVIGLFVWLLACSDKEETKNLSVALGTLYTDYYPSMNLGELYGSGYLSHRWYTWNQFLKRSGLIGNADFNSNYSAAIESKSFSELIPDFNLYAPFKGIGRQVYAEEMIGDSEKNISAFQKDGKAALNPWMFLADTYVGKNPSYQLSGFSPVPDLYFDGSALRSALFEERADGGPVLTVTLAYVPFIMVYSDVNAGLIGTHVKLKANETIESGPAIDRLPQIASDDSNLDEIRSQGFAIYDRGLGYNFFYLKLFEDQIGNATRYDKQIVGEKLEVTNWWHDRHNISNKTAFWVKPKQLASTTGCLPSIFCSEYSERGFKEGDEKRRMALPKLDFEIYRGDKLILRYLIRYEGYYRFSEE